MDKLPVCPLGLVDGLRADATPAGDAVHIGNLDRAIAVNTGYDSDVSIIAGATNENIAVLGGFIDGKASRRELGRPIARVP